MNRLRGFYFLRKSGDELPGSNWITFDEIERLLRKRKIDKNWLVRRGGQTEWVTIADLLEHSARGNKRMQHRPAASFPCVKCRVELSVQLKSDATIYRCPQCGANYRALKSSGPNPVFLVVPADAKAAAREFVALQRARNELPAEVRGALTILNLDETATLDAVRQAHREMIKSYQPDAVAHLGPELERIAEVKTKLINSSFAILESFLGARGSRRA